ncbi:MAG: DUF3105 domain-containing protein [Thermoleophilaceae bacterium]|nr:DUF3105 domain-containing protein [Thermoleophilaceae bacterium]
MGIAAAFVLMIALALTGCGGEPKPVDGADQRGRAETDATDGKPPKADAVLPPGGEAPRLAGEGLEGAARAAGCKLESFKSTSRGHVSDPDQEIDYSSAPPTSGKHFATAAEDAAYLTAPDEKALVHSLEHGRAVIRFKADLPRGARASLRAFFEEDSFQTLLTPDETGSDYEVAATAWNRDPSPNGTGRPLGCDAFTPKVFEALQAFKKRHRSKGPEAIP